MLLNIGNNTFVDPAQATGVGYLNANASYIYVPGGTNSINMPPEKAAEQLNEALKNHSVGRLR
jgi:hypothetical protein